jgi:hypothetical protein
MSDSPLKLAYIAEGKLFLFEQGKGVSEVPSPFVEALLERSQRERDRNAWKEESAGWNSSARLLPFGIKPSQLAGMRRIQFTGLARGGENELVYALDTSVTAGLFSQNVGDKSERRLFHKQGFRARDLARRDDGALAMSIRNDDGTANIAVMPAGGGKGLRPLTEGDVIDEHPSWVGQTDAVVYQSAGIGRNQQGMHVATGPYSVMRLNTAGGDLDTLVEQNGFDCLAPRIVGDSLYYIRRPYQPHQPVSVWRVGLDMLAFPYRVCRALVHFLDFFSLMFARKPLITAGGPPKEGPDQRYIMLFGKMIDAEKALREKKADGALVPRDWELRRRSLSTGEESVLATSVLSFDVSNESIVFTNGSHVSAVSPGTATERLVSAKMIERVVLA